MHTGPVHGSAELLIRHTEDGRTLPLQVLPGIRGEGFRDEAQAPVRQSPPGEAGLVAQRRASANIALPTLTWPGIERGILCGTAAKGATDKRGRVPRVTIGGSRSLSAQVSAK